MVELSTGDSENTKGQVHGHVSMSVLTGVCLPDWSLEDCEEGPRSPLSHSGGDRNSPCK